MEKIFQNLRVRLNFNICQAIKIKLFVAREIQYFELGIFSFNSYVYYLTRGFIASTGAFNFLTRAFNLPTRPCTLLHPKYATDFTVSSGFYTALLKSGNWMTKRSRRRCSIKKAVLKNFAIFTGKHLCRLIKLKRHFNKGVFLWILRNF